MKTAEEIYMEVQDRECPNLNNLILPEDWQLKAMIEYAKELREEVIGELAFESQCENKSFWRLRNTIKTIQLK